LTTISVTWLLCPFFLPLPFPRFIPGEEKQQQRSSYGRHHPFPPFCSFPRVVTWYERRTDNRGHVWVRRDRLLFPFLARCTETLASGRKSIHLLRGRVSRPRLFFFFCCNCKGGVVSRFLKNGVTGVRPLNSLSLFFSFPVQRLKKERG